ncbi:MAG: ParB N-terminal domain-containing protein [Pirellulaceae bacterium]|nr:ParB N-terminal domain-containing protein [Pirellulaceae bacterium]
MTIPKAKKPVYKTKNGVVADRILSLRRIPISSIIPRKNRWRKHPKRQKDLLTSLLQEIGFTQPIVVTPSRQKKNEEQFILLDGHLRLEILTELQAAAKSKSPPKIPALVLQLSQKEERALAIFSDYTTQLSQKDKAELASLSKSIESKNKQILASLEKIEQQDRNARQRKVAVPEFHHIQIECTDEEEQREVYDLVKRKGYSCRILTL